MNFGQFMRPMPQAPAPIQTVDETDIIDSTAAGMQRQLQNTQQNNQADARLALDTRHQDTSDLRERDYANLANRQQDYREQEGDQLTEEKHRQLSRDLMDKLVHASTPAEAEMYRRQLAEVSPHLSLDAMRGSPPPGASGSNMSAANGRPSPIAASDTENWQKGYMQGGPAAPAPKPTGGSDYGQLDKDLYQSYGQTNDNYGNGRSPSWRDTTRAEDEAADADNQRLGARRELAPSAPSDITRTPFRPENAATYRDSIADERGDSEDTAAEDGNASDAYDDSMAAGGLPPNFNEIMRGYMSGGQSAPMLPGQPMQMQPDGDWQKGYSQGGGPAPEWLRKAMAGQ